ncbi:ABC transporter permease [Gorillibacterium timonense]|uniref:ABC transporter permease n=1 Tax=Gorillibacterium timonense TaxID=1689269 RepID=UPI00071C25C8|nr:ABC transporter permease subunit [Gorillibacterium timonense]
MAHRNRWQPKAYQSGSSVTPASTGQASSTSAGYPPVTPGGFAPADSKALSEVERARQVIGSSSKNPMKSMVKRLSKHSPAYLTAWVLFGLLILTAVLGTWLMPHSIADSEKFQFRQELVDGQTVYTTPPVKPNSEFLLGTDHRGIDLLSLLLNGMKLTLGFSLSIALCRFLIGVPLGLWGGSSRFGRSFIRIIQMTTSAVPALILLFPALYMAYYILNLSMVIPGQEWKLTLFSVMLFGSVSFLGIAPVADQVAERTRFFTNKEYVSAARLMGAGRVRIARRHILPNLAPELLFAFLAELIQVLFLLGQLAVLGIFLGGSEIVNLEDGMPTIQQSRSGEWCALISYGTRFIQFYPHILLGTGLFFILTVAILKFFLTQLQKKHTRVRDVL